MRFALVLASFASLATGCTKDTGSKSSDEGSAAIRALECTTDDECTLVSAGGCDNCTTGGTQRPMRKDAVAAFLTAQPKRDETPTCAQVMSNDPSCFADAECVRGQCVVGKPRRQGQGGE